MDFQYLCVAFLIVFGNWTCALGVEFFYDSVWGLLTRLLGRVPGGWAVCDSLTGWMPRLVRIVHLLVWDPTASWGSGSAGGIVW